MAKLYIMNGPEKGKAFEFKKDAISIGRVSGNDIQIKEKSISRKHIEILRRNGKFLIKDLNSMNGTFVNGRLIAPGKEFEVEEGVPISIGKIIISLGKKCSDDILSIQNLTAISEEFSETAMFTAYKDRPMTTPKNLEFIYKVSNVLMQSLNIKDILEKILDYLFELLKRIDRGVIILVDEKREITELIYRSAKPEDEVRKIYSHSIVNRVLNDGKSIIMLDTFGQDDSVLSESMEMMRVRSVMCVPLISRSQIRGVLYVDSLNIPYGFRKEDLSLIITLSSPAAIAIENALLFTKTEEIVEKRTKSLKKTEKMLRESEARFKGMFNNMSSGVTIYKAVNDGTDFIILDLNTAHRKIENIVKKNAIGNSLLNLSPEVKETGLLEAMKKVWETGKPERLTVSLSQKDKIKHWREYYIYRLPSSEIVSIFDDLTDKKKAEEEQKILQKQLLVSQKMESIGTFAGGTAHNFRNILQAISGNVEYIEMIYKENQEIKELVNSIHYSVEKGIDLINNLLHYSKGGGEVHLTNLTLNDVILKTYEIIEKVFKENIEILLNLEENLFVKGDRSLLSQVFMNLFTNARDAMPNGGKLVIHGKKTKDKVNITISDTGHGMDDETIDKIFDPFFTLKDVGKGSGLGLSTTLGIVEQHKGNISVSSIPTKGTEFRIRFPLVRSAEIKKKELQKEIMLGKGQKVLIIDDERLVLDSLVYLTNSLGYKTISVDKPEEALKNYNKWAPDIVLIDRSMPQIDGVTCIKRIIEKDPKAKIVIISGYDESGPDGIDKDMKKLIKGYLRKPCKAEELSHTLSRILS